jgi:hypothetical protein
LACVPTTLSQLIVEAGHPTTCDVIVGSADAGDDDAVAAVVAVAIGVLTVVSVDDDPLPGEELEQALNSTIKPHSNNPRPAYPRLKHNDGCLRRCTFNRLHFIIDKILIILYLPFHVIYRIAKRKSNISLY